MAPERRAQQVARDRVRGLGKTATVLFYAPAAAGNAGIATKLRQRSVRTG
jgi:hypothetical protein